MGLNGNPEVAPFVITYRQVFRRPKIEVVKRFVGFSKLVSNVVAKARELFDEVAFDVEKKILDPGESKAVHWAINVRDPFESGTEADLIASQIPGTQPPAGYHFEVIQVIDKPAPKLTEPRNGTKFHTPSVAADRIRKSLSEDANKTYGVGTDEYDDGEAT